MKHCSAILGDGKKFYATRGEEGLLVHGSSSFLVPDSVVSNITETDPKKQVTCQPCDKERLDELSAFECPNCPMRVFYCEDCGFPHHEHGWESCEVNAAMRDCACPKCVEVVKLFDERPDEETVLREAMVMEDAIEDVFDMCERDGELLVPTCCGKSVVCVQTWPDIEGADRAFCEVCGSEIVNILSPFVSPILSVPGEPMRMPSESLISKAGLRIWWVKKRKDVNHGEE